MAGQAKPTSLKEICQTNILKTLEMPLVKLMISALDNSGCKVDLTRHFSCNICKPGNDIQNFGGYVDENNKKMHVYLIFSHKK